MTDTIRKKDLIKAFVLENEKVRAVILPALGGKTASIFYKPQSFELLAENTLKEYRLPQKETAFAECDASGWDDAFPTILPGKLKGDAAVFSYTDHGEIWRSPMRAEWEGDTLSMEYKSGENPFFYQKKVKLDDNCILYTYCIENTGEKDFPCIWTMHGLVRYEPDMELFYPEEVEHFMNVALSKELGAVGNLHPAKRGDYDFRHVPPPGSMTQLKYYASERVGKGYCGYRYPSHGVRCTIYYDAQVLPYLGMWVTAGGFRGDYNCAWEPSNSFYDGVEIAAGNESLWVLRGHTKQGFCIRAELNRDLPERQQK